MKPRLLDLFSGAGGTTRGYQEAGFHVTGVDINPQPNYCGDEFHQADAPSYPLEGYDVIHASPPCQGYTTMNNRHGFENTPRLIGIIRHRLMQTGRPYIIENVSGAKRQLHNPFELTGEMFGLGVHRPRLFETFPFMLAPPRPRRQLNPAAVYGKNDGRRLWTRMDGSDFCVADFETAKAAMGIDWMTWDELREAIPPAYTRFIGEQLMQVLHRDTDPEAARSERGLVVEPRMP